LDCGRSVLIVDPSEETREALRAALEPRGVRILAASQPRSGLALAREYHPDLIVLDLECQSTLAPDGDAAAAESLTREAPLVMLGTARRRPAHLPAGQFVSKPYHYAPLIRKIEELLAADRPSAAAAG
jgi:CheY-like chemotaxis protein